MKLPKTTIRFRCPYPLCIVEARIRMTPPKDAHKRAPKKLVQMANKFNAHVRAHRKAIMVGGNPWQPMTRYG